ncbi:MAG: ATP-binding cassette domain-containing protein [Clostridia bacterium]|nr:ATP-binding cassette domain-containing protein [Clostridia bacterium]
MLIPLYFYYNILINFAKNSILIINTGEKFIMFTLYLFLSIIVLELLLLFFTKKFSSKATIVLKVLSILFAVVYSVRLVTSDKFDDILMLNCSYMSPFLVAFMLFLKGFTLVCVMITALTSFYKCKTTENILKYLVPIISILNIIFFYQNVQAFFGASEVDLISFRSLQFAVETVLMATISIYYFISSIKTFKNKSFLKDIFNALGIFTLLFIAVLPVSFFNILFGTFGDEADGFTSTHRMTLYFCVAIFFVIYFALRNRKKNEKELALVYMATACLIQFCYTININNLSFTNLPFHICNTAVFLIFIAYVFRVKSIFYFTLLVNVIGGMFAMVLPDTSGSLFMWYNVRFWYNHIYITILPVLGVVLNVYERPNLKMMIKAIGIFSIYFVSMIFVNAYVNSFASVDYFFLEGNAISKHASFLELWRINFNLTVVVNNTAYTTHWLYDIFLYFGYIILMFIIWLLYTNIFKVQDHYAEVSLLRKIDRLEEKQTRKKLFGNMNKPLNIRSKKMVNISHFTKKYPSSKVKAVDDFSLKVKEGEVFGFLGHNGSGKSTLIKSMVGIQSITSGKIEICGFDIQKQPLQAKALIGYVSDNHSVYEHLTGREYVNYIADLYNVSKEKRTQIIEKYINLFNLKDAFDNPIKSYSHGMKQKVVVIAALVHEPKVWILDEPLTGLDPTSAFQIKECMREHANKNNIVFFSSHVIEIVEKICDRIAIIKKGKLQGVYDMEQLKKEKVDLEDLYMSFISPKDEEIK